MRYSFSTRNVTTLFMVLALLAPVGCNGNKGGSKKKDEGQQKQNKEAAPGNAEEPSNKTAEISPDDPAWAVQQFLEGARRGDDEAVTALLTPKARDELAKAGRPMTPKADDHARFLVKPARYATNNKNLAYVASIWAVEDPETKELKRDEVIWALRKVSEGWRIAGSYVSCFEGEEPWEFNFEDREQMIAQTKRYLAEKSRREAAAQTAQKPDGVTTR